MYSKEDVVKANIEVHSRLVDIYKDEPHFRSENVDRVKKIIKSLKDHNDGVSLLDVGCGTGFIINIAKEYFPTIRGVDITPAMLEKVNTDSDICDIQLQVADSATLPFADNTFDVCTCHAVLHHLHDISPTIKEIYRVLKPGGIFYSDLDPNYYFWEEISKLSPDVRYSPIVEREIKAVLSKGEEIEAEYHVQKELLWAAEPLKHKGGGFKEEDMRSYCTEAGFTSVDINHEWFLGEGVVINNQSTKDSAEIIRNVFHEMLPLSRHLFKYIGIIAVK